MQAFTHEGPTRDRFNDVTERSFDAALRPRSFDEYIGQGRVVDNLRVYDLATDADEMKSLTGDAAAAIGGRTVLDPLWLFRTFNKEWKKSVWGNAANVSARFAEDMGE